MSARYGYGPNGRALKKDGTERAPRRTLTTDETLQQLAENEARAFAGIGKKVLTNAENLDSFNSGLDIFKRWVSECKSFGDVEKREAKRISLQSQIDALDSKGVAAEAFLPTAQDAIDTVNGLYARIGRGYRALIESGKHSPEDVSDMIRSEIDEEVMTVVESANDPANDPLANFRRISPEDNTSDDDTL